MSTDAFTQLFNGSQPSTEYDDAARIAFGLYAAYQRAGFSKKQSLKLVSKMIASAACGHTSTS